MAKIIRTITVPFTEEDRGLCQKVDRLAKRLGMKSKAGVMRRAILALWEKEYPKTAGGAK